VWCWAANEAGQCGSPGGPVARVTRVPRITAATRVAAGESSACAIEASGHLSCWGSLASIVDAAARAHRFIDVAVSSHHVCAVDGRGVPWCWGTNGQGAPVEGVDHATTIAAGYAHSCVLRSDRSVWCWGRLGDATVAPRAVEELRGSAHLAAAGGAVCGLLSEGNARCVGRTTSPFANHQTRSNRSSSRVPASSASVISTAT
jgi:alpha-tubulin suppressor-like RCC1 family protein